VPGLPPWLESVNDALRPVYRPAWNAMRSRLLFETNADYRSSVFLSSGARMGSTWIAETINYRRDYRYMFEPITLQRLLATPAYESLLPGKDDGVVVHSHHSYYKKRPAIDTRLQYVRPDERDTDLRDRADAVLSGRFRHPEIDQYNYTARMRFERRLIKETRSNLTVRWLYEQFPGLKVVLLTRHPIPTIHSRLEGRVGRQGEDVARIPYFHKLVFGQPKLTQDYLAPFRNLLESAQTGFEQRMAVWCIQNFVPLRQFAPGEIHVAFYEEFCVEPLDALRRLFAFLGDPTDDESIAVAADRMTMRSSTTHARTMTELIDGSRVDGMKQVSKWLRRVTDAERRTATAMLTAFGLDSVYSSDDPLPKRDGLARLMHAAIA
jgi:hypothetical protein